jgi:hypothetical protein
VELRLEAFDYLQLPIAIREGMGDLRFVFSGLFMSMVS